MAQTVIETLESLLIKEISKKDQEPLITFTKKILTLTKDDDYLQNPAKQAQFRDYEKQIDQLVYKLYALTSGEIEIVEGRK